MKKNLLIFFGEYRTFEYIIPQLKRLNEVDVIFSTWDFTEITSRTPHNHLLKIPNEIYNIKSHIVVEDIKKILPNCNPIIHKKNSSFYNEVRNLYKMHFHWIQAIDIIQNEYDYDKLILHRSDMVSNWDTLLDRSFEKDTIYMDAGQFPSDDFWVGDYMFAGNFNIMKKFIDLFKDSKYITPNQTEPHYYLGKAILENNIKWDYLKLNTSLVRYEHIELFDKLNKSNIKFLDLNKGCNDWMYYYELIKTPPPPY